MGSEHERRIVAERRPLPQRRHSINFTEMFWGQPWHVTCGFYTDNVSVGEVFVNAARTPGTDLDAMARDGAILLSLALQYGIPVDVIRGALTRNPSGGPSSIVGLIADRIASIGAKI
jgi:hypothetical protein